MLKKTADMHQSVTITIDRLRLRACHGVSEQERAVGNDYEVSVSLDCPAAVMATGSDELTDTLNYAEIVETVCQEMNRPSLLLEHVAGRIRDSLCKRFPTVAAGNVTVTKLLPPIAGVQLAGASVTLRWDFLPYDSVNLAKNH